MSHLGTFRKPRHTPPPAGLMTWLVIIGYVLVALSTTAAVIRIDQAGKIQASDSRV